MRRVAGLVAVAALLAGCGSTVQVSGTATAAGDGLGGQGLVPGAVSGTSAPGLGVPGAPQALGPAGSGAQAPGVTATLPGVPQGSSQAPSARVTTPIQIGFMSTNVGNASQLGANVGQSFTDKQGYEALVAEYNAHGGLAGRQIKIVYGDTDTASSDWNTQFQAACQKLTQDNHVAAVLGYVFVFLDSFEKCLSSKGIPHLYGGYQPGDVQAQRDFPSIVSVAHPTVDGINETVLSGALASGRLTTKSKLGILYDGCAHGDRAFSRSTEPWLKAHGIHYEAVYMDCAQGSSDVGPATTAIKSAQLQFAAHGVDVVMINNNVAMLLFMNNAESQGYRPQYVQNGLGWGFEANANIIPRNQMRNIHGFGWFPGMDVNAEHRPYPPTPQQKTCLQKLAKHGLVARQYNDFVFAYTTCDALDIYSRALTLTGGRSDLPAVMPALMRTLSAFRGSTTYEGAFSVSSKQRGGPGRYRESGFDDSCACFTYRGPVRRIPTA